MFHDSHFALSEIELMCEKERDKISVCELALPAMVCGGIALHFS